jgi:ribose transport system ATP-binding protein
MSVIRGGQNDFNSDFAVTVSVGSVVTGVMEDAPQALLRIQGLAKRFTGTLALDNVAFDVHAGEIHALLGQNGAGKSTLIKILAGVYPAQAGEIFLDGARVFPDGQKLPINSIHQDLGLVDGMSVAENVAVFAGYRRGRAGFIDWRATAQSASRALLAMDSDINPMARVATLSSADKSIVAIARALSVECKILILDEPTAALPEVDVERLFEALRRLRERGIGIVYVTHRLDEVFRLADRVTVLRDGRKIATEPVGAITAEGLVSMIVGRGVGAVAAPATSSGKPIVRVKGLAIGPVGPVSFDIRPGETVGLVGLRGAGHDVVGRALFGDRRPTSGEVELDGKTIAPHNPAQAMAAGLGFISGKRGEESLAAGLNLQENIYINPTLSGAGLLVLRSRSVERRDCEKVLARYSVRPPQPTRPIVTLSGGNQQKVVVARWLEAKIRLLILEDPTIGVDVGSKAEIYTLLQASLAAGMAALLISADFEEIAKICNRAIVFNRGRVVAEIPRTELTVERLTTLAAGTVTQHA